MNAWPSAKACSYCYEGVYQTVATTVKAWAHTFEFNNDERLDRALGYKDAGRGSSQWSVKQGEELVAHRVACAAEAVKGLRSSSLAPMNDANYKTVRVALHCLPRYGWKVHKGSFRSRLKTAPDTIFFSRFFVQRIGRKARSVAASS